MKPKLIVTTLREISSDIILPVQPGQTGSVSIDLEIRLTGTGDFSKYVKDGSFDKMQLASDILYGKIKIVGYENMNQ